MILNRIGDESDIARRIDMKNLIEEHDKKIMGMESLKWNFS
jgi:hypothetical protein